MIQLSNLMSKSPETPVKTAGAGAPAAAFAEVFAGELGSGAAAGGKSLPDGGNALPSGLPVSADAEANATAIKLPLAAKALIQAGAPEAIDEKLKVSDTPDAKGEASRPGADQVVIAKALATELKVKVRPDRQVRHEGDGEQPVADGEDAAAPLIIAEGEHEGAPVKGVPWAKGKDSPTDGADTREGPAIDVLPDGQSLPLVAVQVAVPQQPERPARDAAVPDDSRPVAEQSAASQAKAGHTDVPSPAIRQVESADRPAEGAKPSANGDGSRQADTREGQRQADASRTHNARPEFRFELTRDNADTRPRETADTRAERTQVGQGRMQLAPVLQIATPEQGAVHGHAGDGSASSAGTNPTSAPGNPAQALRPHEFTTLVDRLVEARETARAGSVNVAVMHADFGEVSLRFHQDGGNLSVSMSNSDPDFARAVGAATHADGAQTGDSTAQGGRRDDAGQNASAFSRGGAAGNGGQASGDANMTGGGRQQAQHDPRAERASQQARMPVSGEKADRDGIYA